MTTRNEKSFVGPGKRRTRTSEVLLHISGKAALSELAHH